MFYIYNKANYHPEAALNGCKQFGQKGRLNHHVPLIRISYKQNVNLVLDKQLLNSAAFCLE